MLFFHLGLNTIIRRLTGGVIEGGRWGLSVDFFFMLSGFVLARSFLQRQPSLSAYFVKRVRRLAPVFLLTTTAALLLAPERPPVQVIAANLLMVQSLLGLSSINFPSWSIPFELFLPVVGVFAGKNLAVLTYLRVRILLVALGAVGSLAVVVLAIGYDYQGIRAAAGLGFGMVLYQAGWRPRVPGTLLAAGFGSVLAIMLFSVELPIIAVAFYPLSAWCIVTGASAQTLFSSPPFQALGRWSYSIYLLHIPAITAAALWLGEGQTRGMAAKTLIVLVILALAGFVHRFIEVPLMKGNEVVQSTP